MATPIPTQTVVQRIAGSIFARGVDRVSGLQGGHLQPLEDHLRRRDVRVVDLRQEGAGVHMVPDFQALSAWDDVAKARQS